MTGDPDDNYEENEIELACVGSSNSYNDANIQYYAYVNSNEFWWDFDE